MKPLSWKYDPCVMLFRLKIVECFGNTKKQIAATFFKNTFLSFLTRRWIPKAKQWKSIKIAFFSTFRYLQNFNFAAGATTVDTCMSIKCFAKAISYNIFLNQKSSLHSTFNESKNQKIEKLKIIEEIKNLSCSDYSLAQFT